MPSDLVNKEQPVVFEKTIQAPTGKVWDAVTNRDSMRKWYFDIPDFRPEPGAEFSFDGGTEEKTYKHLCRITEVVPEKKISYSWRYEGYEGDSLVTFELFREGDATRVRVTHKGLESFPPIQDFAKENFAEGWKQIIGTNLGGFVEETSD